LKRKYPNVVIIKEWKSDECTNSETGRRLPFDFYIPEFNVIVEIDGPQHFVQVSNWQSPEETQKMDRFKENFALSQNINVIRLLQTDVLYDRNDWEILFEEEFADLPIDDEPRMVVKIYGGEVIKH